MTPFFNLVDEPWIPCLGPDNRPRDLSLLDILCQAQDIREIHHPSPLVVTALHRLLLAILHRNFGPDTDAAWLALWRRGCWDGARITQYLRRWHDRFFLWHPQRPFYQVPYLAEEREHPIQLLALEAAAGNNPSFFDHHHSAAPAAFSPAQAACYLLARQQYAIGFGKSKPFYFSDSPLIRGYTLFLTGRNLFETLALNLLRYNDQEPLPGGAKDLPVWERDELPEPDQRGNLLDGYLHYLTWQSRRIHLLPPQGNPPVCRFCQLLQNWKLPEDPPPDPFKAYSRDEKRGLVPFSLNPEKAVWRDCHTLFQPKSRPRVLEEVARRARSARGSPTELPRAYQFTLTGLVTEAGKAAQVILWRQERLPLPLAYLEDVELLGTLEVALAAAEKTADILKDALRRVAGRILAPDLGGTRRQADRREVSRLVASWGPERRYWARLELPFRELLVALPQDKSCNEEEEVEYGGQVLPVWREQVAAAARRVFAELAGGLEPSCRSLRAVAQEEGLFYQRLQQTASGGAL